MRTLLIFVLLATTTYAHAEIKAWKNYFSGSINYQTSEFTLTFKKGEDSNRIIFSGEAVRACLACGLSFFEEHGLSYDKNLILDLRSQGGGNTVFHDFMGSLASKCEANLPNESYPVFFYDQFYSSYSSKTSDVKRCKLITIVKPRQKCASFCTALFQLGKERLAYSDSRFGFHAASGNLLFDIIRFYNGLGVDLNWLNKNKEVFQTTDMTYFKGEQLTENGMVTRLK